MSERSALVCVFLLIAAAATLNASKRCVLPLPRFAFFAPLIYNPLNGSLIESDNVSELQLDIAIPHGDKVLLSCAPNFFKNYPDKKVLEVTCHGQKEMIINGEIKSFLRHLACEVRPIEEIITPIDGCASDMEAIEYGYANPIDHKSYVLGEACYSKDKGYTQFVHMKKTASENVAHANIRIESAADYFLGKHPDSKYKLDLLMASRLDTLEERLRVKLGRKKIPFVEARNLIGLDILPTKQFMSVLKLGWNYVPVVGFDHMPNLDVLQSDVYELKDQNVDIYMGAHGVLKLTDENDVMREIYMDEFEDRFPVPEYIWMVVVNGNRAAAFAILNNPDAQLEELEATQLCESKCDKITWLHGLLQNDSYKNVKKGRVTCCTYDELRNSIKGIPTLRRPFEMYW